MNMGGANPLKAPPKWAPRDLQTAEIETLAIVVNTGWDESGGYGLTPAIASHAEQEFTQASLTRGYQLVSRLRIEEWKRELELQGIGLTDPRGVTRAGSLLNATHILVITPSCWVEQKAALNSSTRRTHHYYAMQGRVDCQILYVPTARCIAACSDSAENSMASDVQDLLPLLSRLSKRVASKMPSRVSAPVL